jgi:hypothetical protein
LYPNQQPPSGFSPQEPMPGGYGTMPEGNDSFGASMPPAQQGTNGFAIASLVSGIFAGACGLSVVFGLIALNRIKKTGQRGRGMAIAGIVLTAVWVVAAVIGAATSGKTSDTASAQGGSSSSETASSHSESVMTLHEGDCLNNIEDGKNNIEDGKRVGSVKVIPCSQPHDSEVIATFELPRGEFPGEPAVAKQAEDRCSTMINHALANSPMLDQLSVSYLYPSTKRDWKGDRGVTCMVSTDSGPKLTGKVPR